MDDPKKAAVQQPPASQQHEQTDKTMAVLAFIFAFVIPIVGLILSIINLKKYPKGVDGHKLNKAALILSIIFTVIFPLLIAIGAVAYFGVLSPGNLLPERTTFKAPFLNMDNAVITERGGNIVVEVPFINSIGSAVTIVTDNGVTGIGDCSSPTLTTTNSNPTNGEDFILSWTCNSEAKKGDKFEATLGFSYLTNAGMTRPHTGEVYGQVR